MTHCRIIFRWFLTSAAVAAGTFCAVAEGDANLPKFQEVFQLVQANLAGANATELDRAAVKGFLDQLQTQVQLEPAGHEASEPPLGAGVDKVCVYDRAFAYFHVGAVQGDLGIQLREAYHHVVQTNATGIKGVILDLRFARGTDFAAAGNAADCFLNTDQPLLGWGSGSARATRKDDPIAVPVAVLVNSHTSGSAEALAAVLRHADAGLLLGTPTAGQAAVPKEFPLANGQKLLIAATLVQLGNGEALSHPLVPDILVDSTPEDERAWLEDPFKVLHPIDTSAGAGSVTNLAADVGASRPIRRLPTEADLVRAHRSGTDVETEMSGSGTGKDVHANKVIADPVLARAVDFLKGLAVIHERKAE